MRITAEDIFVLANAKYAELTKRREAYIDNAQLRCVVEALAEVLTDFTTPVVTLSGSISPELLSGAALTTVVPTPPPELSIAARVDAAIDAIHSDTVVVDVPVAGNPTPQS